MRAGFAPPEEAGLALPRFIYGLDVLTEIARHRWGLRQSLSEIHAAVRATSDLPISERSVDYAMQTWQELATASVLRDRRRIAALQAQGTPRGQARAFRRKPAGFLATVEQL